ncbi:hypothetical protein HRD49_18210 [Corallococcus exiguus]|uniref:hypothetical protein n=1 Tax=Corallococcus TaxID=83461 RepID=UPI000EA0A0C3|nr:MULTISPECIES: hypothetical protein [Corallococcus]NRD63689.1 hypothetical protein [Corallococcus exiguus]RKH20083.1 hypothetical protein D7V77_31595 [Corallococcus sp. CA041A]RUO92412.1 hypothetical protein D7Y11_14950 [Corallococcus sp. AB018]
MPASQSFSRTACTVALLALVGCGSATVGGGGSPAQAKWVSPIVSTPDGGQLRTTIYYGPWQCSAEFLSRCESKCAAQGHALMGCMWLADIKGDWQGRYLFMPAEVGGRLAITHCCCDYPAASNLKQLRTQWNKARPGFREDWAQEFGAWPAGKDPWPGHHIFDLAHGGPATAPGNILPTPPDVHDLFSKEYPACYAPGGKWLTPGPARPYVD